MLLRKNHRDELDTPKCNAIFLISSRSVYFNKHLNFQLKMTWNCECWLYLLACLLILSLLVRPVCTDSIALSTNGIWEGDYTSDRSKWAYSRCCARLRVPKRYARVHDQGRRVHGCLIRHLWDCAKGRRRTGKTFFLLPFTHSSLMIHHVPSTWVKPFGHSKAFVTLTSGYWSRAHSERHDAWNKWKQKMLDEMLWWQNKSLLLLRCDGRDKYHCFRLWLARTKLKTLAKVQQTFLFFLFWVWSFYFLEAL